MRLVLDACVLFPTVLREILIGTAEAGLFDPVWSARILEEWRRAAERQGVGAVAAAEIAVLKGRWPHAMTEPEDMAIRLPDPGDAHVVAAAVSAGAEGIVTLNIRDFPLRALAPLQLNRHEPDTLLLSFFEQNPEKIRKIAEDIRAKTEAISGGEQPLRSLLKRARLPRLGKRLG